MRWDKFGKLLESLPLLDYLCCWKNLFLWAVQPGRLQSMPLANPWAKPPVWRAVGWWRLSRPVPSDGLSTSSYTSSRLHGAHFLQFYVVAATVKPPNRSPSDCQNWCHCCLIAGNRLFQSFVSTAFVYINSNQNNSRVRITKEVACSNCEHMTHISN